MANYAGHSVSLSSVVRTPAFRQGFKHYQQGVEPIFDEPEKLDGRGSNVTNLMWAYERGRAFAAWCKGEGVKLDHRSWFIDRGLSGQVLDAANDALRAKAIR